MLELDLPFVVPSYMCFSRHFEHFIADLSVIGVNKIIVLHDFDFSTSDIFSHNKSLRDLKKKLTPVFKSHAMKFKIISNALLDAKSYSLRELSCLADEKIGYYFMTLPLSSDQAVAMKNIFTLKNAGYFPIINSFERSSIIFKKSFCEAILTTEDISFVFDTASLSDNRTDQYLRKALSSHNTVLFSVSQFTSSVIERELLTLWNSLDPSEKMNLGYHSRRFMNHIFK